jgi:hypothetical protein
MYRHPMSKRIALFFEILLWIGIATIPVALVVWIYQTWLPLSFSCIE